MLHILACHDYMCCIYMYIQPILLLCPAAEHEKRVTNLRVPTQRSDGRAQWQPLAFYANVR